MPGLAVVGLQWGDEGKGKVVDVYSSHADAVVRFAGGANAGHTLSVEGRRYVLHLLPSGIVRPQTRCLLAAGMVIDVEALVAELEVCEQAGLNPWSRVTVSPAAHVVTPFHKAWDRLHEAGEARIGTTLRGIGPCYADRANRVGIPVGWLEDETRVRRALEHQAEALAAVSDRPVPDVEEALDALLAAGARLRPLVGDVRSQVASLLHDDRLVVFEGAQGSLLDILHGTYPHVTSSSTLAANAAVSCGIGPQWLGTVVGVAKAYATRVGLGPFPSEASEDVQELLRTRGGEFGATTGRPRRCGWLDLPALRTAVRMNGVTELAITKLDVLSGLEEVPVVTSYRLDGRTLSHLPEDPMAWDRLEPRWEKLKGWPPLSEPPEGSDQLPAALSDYIEFIERETGVTVAMLSFGPARSQTLWRDSSLPDKGSENPSV